MKFLSCFLAAVLLLFVGASVVHAGVDEDINQLTQKIAELQGQEDSLSKQIGILNSRISLTTLKIQSTKNNIDKLVTEIDDLNNEIDRLEKLKTKRLELIIHRVPEVYKRQVVSQFGIVLFSKNVSDFLTRIKYVNAVEAEDAQLYKLLQNTQDNFNERKNLREQKRTQQEELQVQLQRETAELARQKRDKQVILEQTRNSEAVYQRLLAQALAEKRALEAALVDSVKVGPVKRGDPIALVGNTGYPGCSTGAHLHFEVHNGGSWADPAGFLSNKTVNDEQNGGTWNVGGGSWAWPLQDPIRITQHYGQTPYSYVYKYSGGLHTGFDMVSESTVIRAPEDGTLFASSQACGGSSIIKIKYIEHASGIISFYLHVQ